MAFSDAATISSLRLSAEIPVCVCDGCAAFSSVVANSCCPLMGVLWMPGIMALDARAGRRCHCPGRRFAPVRLFRRGALLGPRMRPRLRTRRSRQLASRQHRERSSSRCRLLRLRTRRSGRSLLVRVRSSRGLRSWWRRPTPGPALHSSFLGSSPSHGAPCDVGARPPYCVSMGHVVLLMNGD